jgi:hypothetical protein
MPPFIFPITPTHVPLSSLLGSPLSLFPKSPSPLGTAPALTSSVRAASSSVVSLPVSFFPDLPPSCAHGLRGRDPPPRLGAPLPRGVPPDPSAAWLLPPARRGPVPACCARGRGAARPWHGGASSPRAPCSTQPWRGPALCAALGTAPCARCSPAPARRGHGVVRPHLPSCPMVRRGPVARRGPALLTAAWPRRSSRWPGTHGVVRRLPGAAPSCAQHLGTTRRAPDVACGRRARAPARVV